MTLFPRTSQVRRLPWAAAAKTLRPHWGALLALALFLGAGLAVLDDYGVAWDEPVNALRAASVWGFLTGNEEAYFDAPFYVRIYGPSFELALLFAERALGIEGVRSVHLAQHLLIHLSFLTGGLFAYFLARRLSGNSLVGIFAMAIFLLHPRLYAHSFFNSKDIAFLVAFIVALHLAHRAFKRDTLLAFTLLGVGVGIAVNLRIMGVVLLAAIPTLRALDFAWGRERGERKRILLTTGAFALASLLTVYVLLPYLWANPLERAVEWWTTLSDHPHKPRELFRGMFGRSVEFPEYLPVWFSITSPPFALALGLVGAMAVLVRAIQAPRSAVRNGSLRFGLMLIGCIAAPAAAVILLNASAYNGWRHLYFLWAPFSLLGSAGLAWLASALRWARLRAAVYGAVGAGLAATALSMVLIHPNQQVFFNFTVDRVATEHLRMQYVMDYLGHSRRQGLEWISQRSPSSEQMVHKTRNSPLTNRNAALLPDADRALESRFDVVPTRVLSSWSRSGRALHQVKVYGSTIMAVEPMDDLRAVYEATRGRQPAIDSAFDVYYLDDAVALVMEPCAPAFLEMWTFLRAIPVTTNDLPPWHEGKRFEPRRFHHAEYGALFDGKCVVSLPLPNYPVADIEVVWSPLLIDDSEAADAMRQARASGVLLARSFYDLYLSNDNLVYVKENCDPLETEHSFFLNIYPQRADDLPEFWRERGSERIGFGFLRRGALLPRACVALFPLPDYPIAGFQTGQRLSGGNGNLWRASISANPEPYAAAYREAASSEPAARSMFDVHLSDGALVYVKEPCEQADTEARFFLHVIPQSAGDLPEDRREYGFNGLDFDFFLNGAWFDGKCAARVALPDYPVVSVRTGQHVSGVREIWSAEFAVAEP